MQKTGIIWQMLRETQVEVTIEIHLDYCAESKDFAFHVNHGERTLTIQSDNFGAINFLHCCKHWIVNKFGYDLVLISPATRYKVSPAECAKPLPA